MNSEHASWLGEDQEESGWLGSVTVKPLSPVNSVPALARVRVSVRVRASGGGWVKGGPCLRTKRAEMGGCARARATASGTNAPSLPKDEQLLNSVHASCWGTGSCFNAHTASWTGLSSLHTRAQGCRKRCRGGPRAAARFENGAHQRR